MELFVRPAFLASIALMAVSAAAAQGQQALDDAQIRELLAGKSALFADYSVSTYGADGSYSYLAANNLHFKGKYVIGGGKVCVTFDDGQRRCDAVSKDAQGPYLRDSAGRQLRLAVRAPMTSGTVTTLCGVPVAYTIKPPAADVPADLSAFSGIWVGTWNYGMCAALVVESIQADGTATVIYVNGAHAPDGFKAGSFRFAAIIKGNRLSDGGTTASFEAMMGSPNELSAKRIGPPGAGTAKFARL
jgi:hypothetical protein